MCLPVEDRGMRGLVTMLADEAKAPGVCDKRVLIIHKLEELLARLGARAVTLIRSSGTSTSSGRECG